MKIFRVSDNTANLAFSLIKSNDRNILKNAVFPFSEFTMKFEKAYAIRQFKEIDSSFKEISFKVYDNYNEVCVRNKTNSINFNVIEGSILEKGTFVLKSEKGNFEHLVSQETSRYIDFYYAVVCVICIFINTKGLLLIRETDYSKLNKKRIKKGNLPLQNEIIITLNKTTIEQKSINVANKSKRRLHDVRSHFRFKNGKIELVKAHKRGDASLGIINSSYNV